MIANSFWQSSNKSLKKSFIAILQRPLLYSIASLPLLTSAAAQIAPHAFSKTERNPLFRSRRDVDIVPGTRAEYHGISPEGRLEWFGRSTAGGVSLLSGVFSAALGTALDTPSEYGPHWEGFGKRYGMRLTGISTGNAIEVLLGMGWGEDPRYFPKIQRPFGIRVKNIVDLTFRAYRGDGERHLAYARYAATFGNNFLSNTWRTQSEADWQHAVVRTAEGFGARALSNTFREFVPQVLRKIRHKPGSSPRP